MVETIFQSGVYTLNILISLVILGFIKRQNLKRYSLLKNSFYGFYATMAVYFFSHFFILQDAPWLISLGLKLEITAGIFAAWIFGNIVITLRYPDTLSSRKLLQGYFSKPSYPHIGYSVFMFSGLGFTWFGNPVQVLSHVPQYSQGFVLYVSFLFGLAIAYPTYSISQHVRRNAGVYSDRFRWMSVSYALLIIVLYSGHVVSWYVKNHEYYAVSFLVSILPLGFMAYTLKEPTFLEAFTFHRPVADEKSGVPELLDALGNSALIEYTPTEDYAKSVVHIIASYLSAGRNVVIVSQAPRAGIYRDKFDYFISNNIAKVVSISSESPTLNFKVFSFHAETSDEDREDRKEVIRLSIHNLEYLSEIVDHLPKRSVLIFEALSGLLLGLSDDASVYKFFTGIVEKMSHQDRSLVACINSAAHEPAVVSSYEGLFLNIFRLEGDSVVSLKGSVKKIPFEIFEEDFSMFQ